ncbi:MAG: hypothetical protein GXP29_08810 [Planctomycetes bacterium]|nr:hypothetical protein [Planctomycetota bacterium]
MGPNTTNFGELLYSSVFAVAAAFLAIVSFKKYRNLIDEWLSSDRTRRAFFSFAVLLCGIGSGAFADWIDFSEIADGNVTPRDRFLLPLFIFTGIAFIWSSTVFFFHNDQWHSKLNKSRKRAMDFESKNRVLSRDFRFAVSIGQGLVWALEQKAHRIDCAFDESKEDGSVASRLLRALDPFEQQYYIVQAIHFALLRAKPMPESHHVTGAVRVGLYVEDHGAMKLRASWDGKRRGCLESAVGAHSDKFRLTKPSGDNFVVNCAMSSAVQFIEDAALADLGSESQFRYYDSDQREEIKSLVGFRIEDSTRNAPRKVIVFESNVTAYFSPETQQHLFDFLRELAGPRICFEEKIRILQNTNGRDMKPLGMRETASEYATGEQVN